MFFRSSFRALTLGALLGSASLGLAAKPSPVDKRVAQIQKAVAAYQSGDYEKTRSILLPLVDKDLLKDYRSRDYLLFALGDSEALLSVESDSPSLCQAAITHLKAVESVSETPLTMQARARQADCLRITQKTSDAEAAYRSVISSGKSNIDLGMARFRLANLLAPSDGKQGLEARQLLRKLYIDHPLHPMAEPAISKLKELDQEAKLDAQEHLDRAKNLLSGRRWAEAVSVLQGLPPDLGPALRDEVDYWLGTTFYRMRRNYGGAAQLLLTVAKRLKGDRQADAMFHGARALSRADRDDEAIVGYRDMLSQHPHSRYSAEASFLIGWLEYNRRRYTDAITNLQETLRRFSGPYADEARWYIGLSRYLLADYAGALPEFDALAKRGGAVAGKANYWAGVALFKQDRKPEAIERWQRLVDSQPLGYYGMLARVRLGAEGVKVTLFADAARRSADGLMTWPKPGEPLDAQVLQDPQVARATELLTVGLLTEASVELRRSEPALMQHYGAARVLPALFDLYTRAQNFQRPHQLAEVYGAAALRKDPQKVPAARPLPLEEVLSGEGNR